MKAGQDRVNTATASPQPIAGTACPTTPESADLHPPNSEPTIAD
jgi:hypothetical protein